MATHLFIVFCLLLFVLIVSYTIAIIINENKKLFIHDCFDFFKKNSNFLWILILPLGIIFLTIILIIKSESYIYIVNEITGGTGLGSLGDFFNGLVAPIISIFSIIYIYKAFQQQFIANEMLYNFEINKNIKEDLDWLRNNSSFLIKLKDDINERNIDEIEIYLISEYDNLNKAIYSLNLFNKIFDSINKKTFQTDYTKSDIENILLTFYLSNLKSIFRDIGNYIENKIISTPFYIDNKANKIELIFSIKFIQLYNNIKEKDSDNAFVFNINKINEKLENGK